MHITKFIFLGWNGKLCDFKNNHTLPPLVERSTQLAISQEWPIALSSNFIDRVKCEAIYHEWGHYGPFGDLIEIACLEYDGVCHYFVTSISNLAYLKAGLAADMVVMFYNENDTIFVGVTRKHNPGKGQAALVGGFIDVNGYKLESPLKAALRETYEEIDLSVTACDGETITPTTTSISVRVTKPEIYIFGTCSLIGVFQTSEQEEVPTLGIKRAYQTTAYLLKLYYPGSLSKELIRALLTPKDDAADLFLADSVNIANGITFGLRHHSEIFKAALKK